VAKCKSITEPKAAENPAATTEAAVKKTRAPRLKKNAGLTFAMMDRRHMTAPGLFRNLKKSKEPDKLDVTYQFSKTESIEFVGAFALGLTELRLFQALVAMCGQSGLTIEEGVGSELAVFLRREMRVKGVPVIGTTIGVSSSYKQLMREMGVATTTDTASIRDSLKKLFSVAVFVKSGGIERAFHLLTYYEAELNPATASGGQLHVGLNPLITQAILMTGQFASLDMVEVRNLKGEVTRFLHHNLCGYIDPGKARSVGIDTLCVYVWPKVSDVEKTISNRRLSVRKGLAELQKMGWKIGEYKKGVFRITRPAHVFVPESHYFEHQKPVGKKLEK